MNQFLKDSNPNILSSENRSFLENLTKKLTKNLEEINDKEIDFLTKSLQFQVIPGDAVLTESDEKKPISELKINENDSIFVIVNLMRGCKNDEENVEEEPRIEEEQTNKTFICSAHGTTTTHYCKTCKKLICGLEILPLDNKQQGLFSFFFITFNCLLL